MQRALDFYVGILGFTPTEWSTNDFTSIGSGKAHIFLARGEQGRGGAWVWVGCDNARELHEKLQAHGVKILLPPTNFPWALEIHVEDPDGNVIRFGSDSE